MNAPHHTYEEVRSYVWMSNVTRMNESCYIHEVRGMGDQRQAIGAGHRKRRHFGPRCRHARRWLRGSDWCLLHGPPRWYCMLFWHPGLTPSPPLSHAYSSAQSPTLSHVLIHRRDRVVCSHKRSLTRKRDTRCTCRMSQGANVNELWHMYACIRVYMNICISIISQTKGPLCWICSILIYVFIYTYAYIHLSWFIHMCAMTHSHVWQAGKEFDESRSSTCSPWLSGGYD